ncbi:DNA helicase INO80, partial [[Emmonsia] crescens]
MAGGPPYTVHSPTQQPRFANYSPSSRDRSSYPNNDPYQPPPHTPPAYPPTSMTRSPHFGHAPSPMMNTTLPPLNGSTSHADASPSYHAHSTSATPQFSLHRPYGSSHMSSSAHSPPPNLYSQQASSHTHSRGGTESMARSPKREHETMHDTRPNSMGYSSQSPMMRDTKPASPKESKPARTDPMSFASILSGPAEERPPRKTTPPLRVNK